MARRKCLKGNKCYESLIGKCFKRKVTSNFYDYFYIKKFRERTNKSNNPEFENEFVALNQEVPNLIYLIQNDTNVFGLFNKYCEEITIEEYEEAKSKVPCDKMFKNWLDYLMDKLDDNSLINIP